MAADALGFYLLKLISPFNLGIDYGQNPQSIIASGVIYYAWLLRAAAAVGIWLARKAIPLLWLAGVLFLLPLLPLLGLVPFDFQTLSTVSDHYVYLPMLGVALAFAALLRWNHRPATLIAGAIICIALAAGSIIQLQTWRDSITLFVHARQVNPGSWAAGNNLAVAALDAGDPQKAIAFAAPAASRKPPYPDLFITLGMAYARIGDLPKALEAYNNALEVDPTNASALASAAAVTAQLGGSAKAIHMIQQAIKLDPNSATAHRNYAIMLTQQGKLDDAVREMQHAVELEPTDLDAQIGLAALLSEQGHNETALLHAEKALELRPNDPRAAALRDEIRARLRK